MKRKVLALAIGLTAVVAFASGSSLNAAHTGASGAAATNSIASERAGNSRLYVINSALYPDTVAAPSEAIPGVGGGSTRLLFINQELYPDAVQWADWLSDGVADPIQLR